MAHRVLVIDDDAAFRRLTREFVESWGCQVATAEDVLTGIRALAAEPADLVVSDYHTPRGCGLDLLNWVRVHDRRVPVFMVSGSWTDRRRPAPSSWARRSSRNPATGRSCGARWPRC
jgi:DNA-binding NtrC family response regulator